MATTFGWKKKASRDLSLKRPAAFTEGEEKDGDSTQQRQQQLSGSPSKRLQSGTGLENRESRSRQLTNEGVVLAEKQRYSDAIRKWNDALTLTPNVEKLHEMKSQVFLQVDKTFEAVKSAEMAVKLNPRWPAAHQALGRAQLRFGEYDMAVKSFSKAVHVQPDDPELWKEDLLWSLDLRKKARIHDEHLESDADNVNED